MVLGMMPVSAFAAETDNLCDHHTEHTADCGYAPAVEGSPCTHECGEECAEACAHAHDALCGYVEAVAEVPCGYVCEESHEEELSEEPDPVCTCVTKCAEGSVNSECTVCSAEGADLNGCTGEEATADDEDGWFTVSGNTVTIDGTLGGKTEATEEDINALVDAIKGYVDSGITTIIVTGSEPAMYTVYSIPAYAEALYRLTEGYDQSPYCGTIDLILPDATEIVGSAFWDAFALNSITLPSVMKLGNNAFYGCCYLEKITFGLVLTEIQDTNNTTFYRIGEEVGGCDLVLNCGQMQGATDYQPNIGTDTWCNTEFKSITLPHIGGEATCTVQAVCTACGDSYGELADHSTTAADDKAATCISKAYCSVCKSEYGEVGDHTAEPTYATNAEDSTQHDVTYSCCGATVTEVHTLDVTTGKCVCGADMTAIATVTDGTNTYYAADAATLNQAVTAILETGSRTFTVELPADAEAGMITAIRRAICDTDGVADGSIHLTLKGVTSIPGTTNWDGVAFGPGDIYDEAGEIIYTEEVTQLASVNLPDVTEIGAQAFYFCENLVTVSAPKAQTIGAQALGYTALTSVEFPELTTIPTDMFSGTWTLSSAKFPKVTTIEQGGLLVGAKFWPENNPTPFPLELTAEGDITFNGSNHFNIASQNYSGKVDLVLNIDKKDQVTFHDDCTATWQVRDDLSYTFKSITFVGE